MSFNILIVDDSKITRSAMRRMLELIEIDLGVVLEAADGREALDLLAHNWIDIVLMDLNMPEMSGNEVIDHMRREGLLDHTPVVVISSERRQNRVDELHKLGVRAFIKKPLRPEVLRDVVTKILGGENVA